MRSAFGSFAVLVFGAIHVIGVLGSSSKSYNVDSKTSSGGKGNSEFRAMDELSGANSNAKLVRHTSDKDKNKDEKKSES